MVKFRIVVDAECVNTGDRNCEFSGQPPTLECFEAGENGGACEQLCFNEVKEIK